MSSSPNSTTLTGTTGRRIVAIDALRGFALFGIIVVHMVEQYLGGRPPSGMEGYAVQSTADGVVSGLVNLLFRGKFFSLFSLLFGLSFFIQLDRSSQRSGSFLGRFAWRLVLLFVIGYGHHLFYRGDILTIYAVLGLCLIPFHRARSGIVLLAFALLYLGLPRALVFATEPTLTTWIPEALRTTEAQVSTYMQTLQSGSWLDVAAANAGYGMLSKLEFQVGIFGRGYLTLALFLLGFYVGRREWHKNLSAHRRGLRWLTLGGGLGAIALLVPVALILGPAPDFNSWSAIIALTFYDLSNLLFTGFLVGGFLLLYLRTRPERVLRWLAPFGKMALTNYVLQSVLGTLVFYGYGLGWLGEVGAVTALLVGLTVFALQVVGSALWLRVFRFGPLEWAWRSLTYLKWQPWLRRNRDASTNNQKRADEQTAATQVTDGASE